MARRRAGKHFNERLKLAATFANNSGIALLVGGLLLPYLTGKAMFATMHPIWLAAPFALHLGGQVILTYMRSED